MRYKVGDEVVLENKELMEGNEYLTIEEAEILVEDEAEAFLTDIGLWVNKYMIDHEKTAELHQKNKTLNHYQGELEKIVADKNNVDESVTFEETEGEMRSAKSEWEDNDRERMMRYGELPTELDKIKPNHYKKNGKDLIDMWKDMFDAREFRAVMKSNIMRYTLRYENKNGVEDLKKAAEFNRRLTEWEESLNV